jgi:hypothetical protein
MFPIRHYRDRERHEYIIFSSKIDQIWNTNFNSSLRANVGVIDVERQGADLMAVPL